MKKTSFNITAQEIRQQLLVNGFHLNHEYGTLLMLITSELGEAMNAVRANKHADVPAYLAAIDNGMPKEEAFRKYIKDTVEDELTDALIRILHTCAKKGIDIDTHVQAKMEYNATRPYKHGKEF